MHFAYVPDHCQTELMQGDVLTRTPEINRLLESIHPHFHNQPKNQFFMVLTQSCDLVLRRNNEMCKSPYITIAPVRSLDLLVERQFAQLGDATVGSELRVMGTKNKTKASEFLQRLFNNNEPGYFYLDSEDTPLPSDCVAFLSLSIAIKADLHYKECLDAKVLQLNDTFQAKLGWLVGQMYSRVGTPDWDTKILGKKVQGILKDAAIWVEDDKVKALENEYQYLLKSDPNAKMSRVQIEKAIKKFPTRKKLVLDQAEKVLAEVLGQEQQDQVKKLRKKLENDMALTSLLK